MARANRIAFWCIALVFAACGGTVSFAQSLLQITSPYGGQLYQEGQIYTITLTADPSVQNLFVDAQYPLPQPQPTSNPTQFTITLPKNIPPGTYQIGAVGNTATTDVEAAPVLVDIERSDTPVSITAQPMFLNFQAIGETSPILATGTYADGTVLPISNSTQTRFGTTNIQVVKPAAPGTGGVVTAAGVGSAAIIVATGPTSNPVEFPVVVKVVLPPSGPAPVITSISTNTGTPGVTQVTVTGSNFGASEGSGYLQLGTMSATSISSWTAGQIIATVPLGSMPGVAEVRQNGLSSNDVPFTTIVPSITSLSVSTGTTGTPVTIQGANFGTSQGASIVRFNRGVATPTAWSAGSITAPVPAGATTGNVVVLVNGSPSNAVPFTVPPSITNLQPPSGAIGGSVTINGNNFGAAQSTSTVTFNGTAATPTSWAVGAVSANVPAGATSGPVVVTVNGLQSNQATFTVTQPPSILNLMPTSGPVGAPVTINGSNFGSSQGTSTVTFNTTQATAISAWGPGAVTANVPTGATTGNVFVTVAGVASNGIAFTVLPTPNIKTLSPTSGKVGAAVTISGTNFGSSQGTSTVTFNGTKVTSVTSWATGTVKVKVPTGATTGNVVVTVNGVASNGVKFTVN